MAPKLKKLLLPSLALLVCAGPAFAEDPFEEAFPSKCEGLTCAVAQPPVAALELMGGAGSLTAAAQAQSQAESRRVNNGLVGDPDAMLKNEARRTAIGELRATNGAAVALLDEKMELEVLKQRYVAAAGDPAALAELKKTPAMANFKDRLAALEGKRSELKQIERQLTARTAELVSSVKKGSIIPEALSNTARAYRAHKPAVGLKIAVGTLLLVDGGARATALLNGNRNPGYLPSVSAGYVGVKHLVRPNIAEANEGAETSMDLQ